MVSLLIAQKADPMAKDERGHTPLEKARSSGSEEIMRQLQGAMVPAGFDSRCRKLLEAAHKGDVARLRELCASQTELVSQRGPRGASALHVAARYGHAEAVEMLSASVRTRRPPTTTGTYQRTRRSSSSTIACSRCS